MAIMDENKSLETESLKRKERLKNLKRKAEKSSDQESRPKFRSYKPIDETLLENAIIKEKPLEDGIEEGIQEQLELLKTPVTVDEIDLNNLAPRKQDWDLKRDITKKLEKLDWRTQKSIAELIRERLKNNQDDIFQAVNLATEFKTK